MSVPLLPLSPVRRSVVAICFVLSTVQFFVAQVVVAGAWPTPYSWTRNWISDLGNTRCGAFALPHGTPYEVCSPLHDVMNSSFVVAGVLFLVGVIALLGRGPRVRLASWAFVLLIVAALCKALVGLAPENTSVALHLVGAANIPIGAIAVLLLSLTVRHSHPGLALLGVVVALVTVTATVLSTATQYGISQAALGLGNGGMERVADYPVFVWMIAVSVAVLAATRTGRPAALREAIPTA